MDYPRVPRCRNKESSEEDDSLMMMSKKDFEKKLEAAESQSPTSEPVAAKGGPAR